MSTGKPKAIYFYAVSCIRNDALRRTLIVVTFLPMLAFSAALALWAIGKSMIYLIVWAVAVLFLNLRGTAKSAVVRWREPMVRGEVQS